MLKFLQGTTVMLLKVYTSFHIKLHISLLGNLKLKSPGTSVEEVSVCCGDVLSSDLLLFVGTPALFFHSYFYF